MLPRLSGYRFSRRRFTNVEPSGYPKVAKPFSLMHPSRRTNLIFVKQCAGASSSLRRSTFRITVSVVVSISSQKQVIGIYAGRVVAAVKNAKTLGYGAIVNLPRYAMSFIRSIVPRRGTVALRAVEPACPKPATLRLNNSAPEPPFLLRNLVDARTFPRAANSIQSCWINTKFRLADSARFCYFRVSQDVNLQDQVSLRLGPFGRRNLSFGLFAFYHGRAESC